MTYLYDPVDPVVQTKYGKIRGYTYGGVDHFFGVKYAKDITKRGVCLEEYLKDCR